MLTNKPQPIGLKELIDRIKKELFGNQGKSDPLFFISKVDLEISLAVERNMNGEINLQVIQSGVEKTMTDTHVIKVSLEPIVTVEEMRKKIPDIKKQKATEVLSREYSKNKSTP